MDEQVAMCVLCERKQKAFDEVCHAFRATENMTNIANQAGMSPTMLRNKLNPEQPHVLSPVELLLITKASGNHTLINSLLLDLGVVTVGFNPEGSEEQTLAARDLAANVHSGDLAQQAGSTRLTRTHKQSLIKTAQSGITVIN
ncbi:phage regulatory CII family protein [Vibrio cortegadensis]|uniref:Phage regulatory CII family protein n=1 Tax=Vibrio cortegadensis TaxID=1328770 RepID=A0ABV4M2P0_9VIBR